MGLGRKLTTCGVACLALVTSLVWLIGWTPESRTGVVVLCLLAAVAGGTLAALSNWNPRLKVAVGSALIILSVLVGFLAIPQAAPDTPTSSNLDSVTVDVSREIDHHEVVALPTQRFPAGRCTSARQLQFVSARELAAVERCNGGRRQCRQCCDYIRR